MGGDLKTPKGHFEINSPLKQSYKSQVKNLENESKLYQSKVTELQEKYKNECAAHKLDEKLKEMYKSQIKILQKGKENNQRF